MLWDEPKIFFLERRYFFSIILSEFLKNRVALHREQRFDEDVGYVYVIAVPNDDTKVKIIDLREKPSNFLRPHTQQAFMMKTSNSRKELGRLSAYQAATFIIPRTLLRLWSNYDNIPSNYMYPNDVTDAGLRFWNGAVKKVIDDGYDFGPLMG